MEELYEQLLDLQEDLQDITDQINHTLTLIETTQEELKDD